MRWDEESEGKWVERAKGGGGDLVAVYKLVVSGDPKDKTMFWSYGADGSI